MLDKAERDECIASFQAIGSLFILPPCPWPPVGWHTGDVVRYGPLEVKIIGSGTNWLGQECLVVMTRAKALLILPIFPQPREMAHGKRGWDAFLSPAAHSIQVVRVKVRRIAVMIASAGATAFYFSQRFF